MKLFISALEPSSNLHAKAMLQSLIALLYERASFDSTKSIQLDSVERGFARLDSVPLDSTPLDSTRSTPTTSQPLLELIGVFDRGAFSEFSDKGVRLSPAFSPSDFSIMGFSDVLGKIPFLLRAQKQLTTIAIEADTIVLLDSSSFHIRLAKRIKSISPSKHICYYILPQLWAWKSWRSKVLERYCDKLLGILPFEAQFYSESARQNGQFCYVGHPLLDELDSSILHKRAMTIQNPQECDKSQSAQQHSTLHPTTHSTTHSIPYPIPQSTTQPTSQSASQPTIVFMPGSRRGEIARIFPTFYEVAKRLPNTRKILVVPPTFSQSHLSGIYETSPSTQGALESFSLCFDTSEALRVADFGFICSGTATLEAALLGVPFVLAYKGAWLDYYIARSLVKLRYIGLANIFYNALCGEEVGRGDSQMHLELIQADMSVENLLQAYATTQAEPFIENAYKLRAYLRYGSAHNVANIVLESINKFCSQ